MASSLRLNLFRMIDTFLIYFLKSATKNLKLLHAHVDIIQSAKLTWS